MSRPRVVVVPDSFKGTITSAEFGEAAGAALADAGCETTVFEAADGGEGTAAALAAALGGEWRELKASDPLGRPVTARWALLGSGEAVVEVAAASGLPLVAPAERDAWAADTYGTGQLIAAAAEAGAARVLVAAGGSATTDGGAGALRALDEAGVCPEIEVICDVATAFEDAPAIFAPQKGADPETVARLERRLGDFAAAAPRDPRGVPMGGCAGGLSGGLWAYAGARLRPGAAFVLDAIGLPEALDGAAAVLTGEGCLDRGTSEGKLVAEVAERARRAGVPCHALVGRCDLDADGIRALGLASAGEAGTPAEIAAGTRALAATGFVPRADG